ncbi:unnamed protein product [Vitrella brassicaformis CCMP3155]|uniref:mannan endo-1,4-beta-mannosidase n=1 Tax=Vitrella brassicaformis (strain CCMP3155) TaxID=1169540 RepID=A0A0G4EVF3_VITBC|nr:unnamed protein product [Vitrella brassicaformis CCMP3155]|eukprot:CEM02606.1 unnamed protein product [Vitrella brassicaformis CCMP3155]
MLVEALPFWLAGLVAWVGAAGVVGQDTGQLRTSCAKERCDFISQRGGRLWLGSRPFRFSGANIYWLGLDENVNGIGFPTTFRTEDAILTAKEMGLTVVRSHTLGISFGRNESFQPTLGEFRPDNLRMADYAVKVAGDHGIRVIVPLMDEWDYYHGGIETFTRWRNRSKHEFYTDPTIIQDFKTYISRLVSHVNRYTGVAWKDDPTIMAWETGNELGPPTSWTQQIAAHLKREAPYQLVMDGRWGVDPASSLFDEVDFVSTHYWHWPYRELGEDLSDEGGARLAHNNGTAFIVGEYDWRGYPRNELRPFLKRVEGDLAVSGALFWSLFPHHDRGGYVTHKDGYTLHYPGATCEMQQQAQLIRSHAYTMSGSPQPSSHGVPSRPLILDIDANSISWRGSTPAATYTLDVRLQLGDQHSTWYPLVATPTNTANSSNTTAFVEPPAFPLLAVGFKKKPTSAPSGVRIEEFPTVALPPPPPTDNEVPFPAGGLESQLHVWTRRRDNSAGVGETGAFKRCAPKEGADLLEWVPLRNVSAVGLWGRLTETLVCAEHDGAFVGESVVAVGGEAVRLCFRVRGYNLDGVPGLHSDVACLL